MFSKKNVEIIFYLLFMSLSLKVFAEGPTNFDEFFEPDGRIRPQYADAYISWTRMTKAQRKAFAVQSKKDFQGDNALSPIPRILTQSEYAELAEGTTQLGLVLKALMKDYYTGKKSYEGKVIPQGVVERIVERHHESEFIKYMDPSVLDHMHFDFGPDTFRASDGSWKFYELNTNFIGGKGDLRRAREVFNKNMPQLAAITPALNDPDDYYRSVVEIFSRSANPKLGNGPNDGVFVLISAPPYIDNEDRRMQTLFKEQGAIVVTPNTKHKLVTTEDGVFVDIVEGSKVTRRKVGFLYTNTITKWIDWQHPALRPQWLIELAKQFRDAHKGKSFVSRVVTWLLNDALTPDEKTGKIDTVELERTMRRADLKWADEGTVLTSKGIFPGLMHAILSGKVRTNITPGTDWVDDKEIVPYIPLLAKHYGITDNLIISPVRSRMFGKLDKNGKFVLVEEVYKEAKANPQRFVIKVNDACGGEGIYVGPNIPEEEWAEGLAKAKADPGNYQLQDYSPPSKLGDDLIDTRMISVVDPGGVYVGPPWSRGSSAKGNGKVNISDHGHELAVMVVPDPVRPTGCGVLSLVNDYAVRRMR